MLTKQLRYKTRQWQSILSTYSKTV